MTRKIINLKIDPSLHSELKETCQAESISMNQYILNAINRELEFSKLWVEPDIPPRTGDREKDKKAHRKAVKEAVALNTALLLHK